MRRVMWWPKERNAGGQLRKQPSAPTKLVALEPHGQSKRSVIEEILVGQGPNKAGAASPHRGQGAVDCSAFQQSIEDSAVRRYKDRMRTNGRGGMDPEDQFDLKVCHNAGVRRRSRKVAADIHDRRNSPKAQLHSLIKTLDGQHRDGAKTMMRDFHKVYGGVAAFQRSSTRTAATSVLDPKMAKAAAFALGGGFARPRSLLQRANADREAIVALVEFFLAKCGNLRLAYMELDRSSTGSVSASDWKIGLANMGFQGEVDKLWAAMDAKNAGHLTVSEFLELEDVLPELVKRKQAVVQGSAFAEGLSQGLRGAATTGGMEPQSPAERSPG